jgi:glycosyltransferase involved in cell wall biosynthesis
MYGGPVRVAYDVSRELVKRGHEVTVYTSDQNGGSRINGRDKELDGIQVHYFRNVSAITVRKMKLSITPEMIPSIRSSVQGFDVVHIHEYRTFQSIVAHYYARKCSVPYVLQAHGALLRIGKWRKVKWIYDLFFGHNLLKDASKVIALSSMEAKQYRSMGVLEEKIEIIPNGIDLSEYADLPPKGSFRKKFGIDSGKRIILYLGRIDKTKGIDLLMKAYSQLVDSMKLGETMLVIAGPDDGYLNDVKSSANSLGISDSVLFTGFLNAKDKLKALVDTDVFVTPSFYGFPITFLEASAIGVPIVTTSDELNWIHNNTGYVIEKSPFALAKAISNILRDEQTRERFKTNSNSIIKNFDISAIVSRIENTYEAVIAPMK